MIDRFLVAFFIAKGGVAAAQKTDAGVAARPPIAAELHNEPVHIKGDQFVIQARQNIATYSGNVRAVRKDATLSCDKLVAHYTPNQEVTSIECVGNAEASQGDKWARGDRADFDNTKGLIVVTGNPEAKQGASHVSGERFTIDLVGDTLHGDKVKTIAAPTATAAKGLVEITGDAFDVQGRKNTATWSGRVRVKRGPTMMSCQRLVAHYGEDQQIRRAECIGRAEAQDGAKWAAGERADYDVGRGLIYVTGNPRARQGVNEMKATRFVIDLPADLIRGDNVEIKVTDPDALKKGKTP